MRRDEKDEAEGHHGEQDRDGRRAFGIGMEKRRLPVRQETAGAKRSAEAMDLAAPMAIQECPANSAGCSIHASTPLASIARWNFSFRSDRVPNLEATGPNPVTRFVIVVVSLVDGRNSPSDLVLILSAAFPRARILCSKPLSHRLTYRRMETMPKAKLSTIRPPGLISLAEAAERLHVSGQAVRRWIDEGLVRGWFDPVSDRPFVYETSLRDYEQNTEPPPDDLMDLHQVAERLGWNINTVMRWIKLGKFKAWANAVTGQNKGMSRKYLEDLIREGKARRRSR